MASWHIANTSWRQRKSRTLVPAVSKSWCHTWRWTSEQSIFIYFMFFKHSILSLVTLPFPSPFCHSDNVPYHVTVVQNSQESPGAWVSKILILELVPRKCWTTPAWIAEPWNCFPWSCLALGRQSTHICSCSDCFSQVCSCQEILKLWLQPAPASLKVPLCFLWRLFQL